MKEIFPGSSLVVKEPVQKGCWLLLGPPGCGKTTFCLHFLKLGLTNGQPCIIVTADNSPEEIRSGMKRLGVDVKPFENESRFRIVDCYSWRTGAPSTSPYHVANPANLSDVSITIENARRGLRNPRVVCDSITTLVLEAGEAAAQKFIQIVTAKIKEIDGMGILVAEAGIHREDFVTFLRYVCDGVFEMMIEEAQGEFKRSFRIYFLKGAKHSVAWVPFNITSEGIVVGATPVGP